MGNPFDPNVPLYEGQQPQQTVQQPVVQQPNPRAASLHFIGGLGELAMGFAHLFASGGSDGEDEEQQEAPRRSVRPRVFGASSARVGKKPCCRRPTGR